MSVCNFKVLFECLTSETEIFNSAFRTQSLSKQLNSFYSFPETVAICVTEGWVAGKKCWGILLLQLSLFCNVLTIYCRDYSPRSNKRRLIFWYLIYLLSSFAQVEFLTRFENGVALSTLNSQRIALAT